MKDWVMRYLRKYRKGYSQKGFEENFGGIEEVDFYCWEEGNESRDKSFNVSKVLTRNSQLFQGEMQKFNFYHIKNCSKGRC